MEFSFELIKVCKKTRARAGILHTPHGDIETPVFMPVGTQAAVKAMSPSEMRELCAGIILSNTYHLHLRPGSELICDAGGLHEFMRWQGAILTDSGGFQVFSLAQNRKITDDGVEFRSHIDGFKHFFTPERSIEIQHNLGADIIMAFDECTPYPIDREYTKKAAERTHSWAKRCKAAHSDGKQTLFGIVQGGMYKDLRTESAKIINEMDFAGNAIGGLSVGEPKEVMYEMLDYAIPLLNAKKPRYLMGVGSPDCLIKGTELGIDMFDCVMQTRMGRTGAALTDGGRLNLRNKKYERDFEPIDKDCGCPACSGGFTKAYIRHLIMAGEILAARLITAHNLYYTLDLMRKIRKAIIDEEFHEFSRKYSSLFDLSVDG